MMHTDVEGGWAESILDYIISVLCLHNDEWGQNISWLGIMDMWSWPPVHFLVLVSLSLCQLHPALSSSVSLHHISMHRRVIWRLCLLSICWWNIVTSECHLWLYLFMSFMTRKFSVWGLVHSEVLHMRHSLRNLSPLILPSNSTEAKKVLMSDFHKSTCKKAHFVFVGLIKECILKYVKKTKMPSDMMTERI